MMRKLDVLCTAVVLFLGVGHVGFTPVFAPGWTVDAAWFSGSGLALVALGLLHAARLWAGAATARMGWLCAVGSLLVLLWIAFLLSVLPVHQGFLAAAAVAGSLVGALASVRGAAPGRASPGSATPRQELAHAPGLRKASAVIRVKGIVLVALGAIHTGSLFGFVGPEAFGQLPLRWATWYSTWFGLTGVLFAFMGVVDLLSCAGLRRGEREAWRYALASSLLAAGLGPTGTFLMLRFRDPGAVFPGTILLTAIVSLPVLLAVRGLLSPGASPLQGRAGLA